jgi:hypothetical protein
MRIQGPALLLVVTLNACSGSLCSPVPSSTQPPLSECTYPNGAAPQMVYPVPNATNVPDTFNVTGVIVADSSGANYNNANGVYFAEFSTAPTAVANYNTISFTLAGFQPIAASALPAQAAPATIPNPKYEVSQTNANIALLGTVSPQTRYYVYLEYLFEPFNPTGPACYAVGPIGDFTTQ